MIAEMYIGNYRNIEKSVNKVISNTENKFITVICDNTESIVSKIETHYNIEDNSINVEMFYENSKIAETISDMNNSLCIEKVDNIIYITHKPIIKDADIFNENYIGEEKQFVNMLPYIEARELETTGSIE